MSCVFVGNPSVCCSPTLRRSSAGLGRRCHVKSSGADSCCVGRRGRIRPAARPAAVFTCPFFPPRQFPIHKRRTCASHPDAAFRSCDVPQELADENIDKLLDDDASDGEEVRGGAGRGLLAKQYFGGKQREHVTACGGGCFVDHPPRPRPSLRMATPAGPSATPGSFATSTSSCTATGSRHAAGKGRLGGERAARERGGR